MPLAPLLLATTARWPRVTVLRLALGLYALGARFVAAALATLALPPGAPQRPRRAE